MGAGVHQYQMTCWENAGVWHCNDIKNMAGRSAKWYTPMRILNLSIEEYINLLINTFNAQNLCYYAPTDHLYFSFKTQKEAKSFCSYINKAAKKINYRCE